MSVRRVCRLYPNFLVVNRMSAVSLKLDRYFEFDLHLQNKGFKERKREAYRMRSVRSGTYNDELLVF